MDSTDGEESSRVLVGGVWVGDEASLQVLRGLAFENRCVRGFGRDLDSSLIRVAVIGVSNRRKMCGD